MPKNYEEVNTEIMNYTGEFGAGTLLVALYTMANFVIVNIDYMQAAYDLVSNTKTLSDTIYGWRQKHGKFEMRARFVPGGNSNIYPPHSYQGATGYYEYYSVYIKD